MRRRPKVNPETSKMLQRRVSELGTLPVMPSILESLGTCLTASSGELDIPRIVELISYDKSLAAQCLRVANSAMFSGRARVQSVRQAVLALGMQRIRDIVYSCSLPQLFAGGAQRGMEQATFWRHALGTALVSQHLGELLRVSDIEKLYLAGLLHDIGILANSLLYPADFQRVLELAEASEAPLCEVEQEILEFTHCESGRVLADIWKLPADISHTIEFHHHPSADDPDGKSLASCISRTCSVVCADWGTDTTRRANSIWLRKFPGRRCGKDIQRQRPSWTLRDLRLSWISMERKCRRRWIRYFRAFRFHVEMAPEFLRCRAQEAHVPSFATTPRLNTPSITRSRAWRWQRSSRDINHPGVSE
jgi:HD-like signal output (HDOD) protein